MEPMCHEGCPFSSHSVDNPRQLYLTMVVRTLCTVQVLELCVRRRMEGGMAGPVYNGI